jgi:MFS family permease
VTSEQKTLSNKFLLYRMLSRMWFIGAIWLYFYRLFINDAQVGVLDGVSFGIGLLAEVPTGALADTFGRDRVLKCGLLMASAGIAFQAIGGSIAPLFLGQVVLMVGLSFVSGADEALFFNKLNFKRDSLEWRKLVTRSTQFGLAGSFIATVVGGYLHAVNPRFPWILTALAFFIAALIVWPIQEVRKTRTRDSFSQEMSGYLADIKTGFMEFRLPKLRLYVPIIIAVQGLFYLTGYGLLRLILLDRFQFSPFWGSVVVAVCSVLTFGLLTAMHKNAHKLSEKNIITAVALCAAGALIASVWHLGILGFIVILALYAGEHATYPIMSEVLNNHAPEHQRATILSVASFLRMLPYVLLAPFIGYANTIHHIEYFLLPWAAIIMISLVWYLSMKKNDEYVRVAQE